MSLFRVITGTTYEDAGVKDTDFKLFYPAVNRNMAWATLEPYVKQAEECFIAPWISDAFYQEVELCYLDLPKTEVIALCNPAGFYKTKIESIPVKDLVVYYLRIASAYYTIYAAMPHLNMRIGDAGLLETNPSDALPVRQWVYNDTRWAALKTGYKYLDKALALMESEIESGSPEFEKYKLSTAYTVSKELLIPNASTMDKYMNIQGSRRAYIGLRPYILKSEKLYISPFLMEMYDEIKTQHTSGALTAANALLLGYIQPLLAEYTIIEATPEINLINQGDGWKVIDTTDGMTMSKDSYKEAIQHLITKAAQNADYYKAELERFLYANITDYPTFETSDANKDKDATTTSTICVNNSKTGAAFI